MKNIYYWCISLLVLTSACVKSFEYEATNYERILVVDGQLTDTVGPHTVKLSYTQAVNDSLGTPDWVTDASVTIQSRDGDLISLTYRDSGIYVTDLFVKGIAGQSYQLKIKLADGTSLISSEVVLIPAPPIDSIYGQPASVQNEILNRNEIGVQFFLDSKDPTGKANFFRYEWESTYLIRVPYPSGFEYISNTDDIVLRTEQVGTCYASDTDSRLIVESTLGNSEQRISETPIHFVSSETDHLRNRYSLLVRQYAIDERTFLFYKKLKEANETAGSLFDIQPGIVSGNIMVEGDPNQLILGNFEVSGVSQIRRYFSHTEFQDFTRPTFRFDCPPSRILETSRDSVNFFMRISDRQIYIIDEIMNRYFLAPRSCTDCTWYATNQKPDWWVD